MSIIVVCVQKWSLIAERVATRAANRSVIAQSRSPKKPFNLQLGRHLLFLKAIPAKSTAWRGCVRPLWVSTGSLVVWQMIPIPLQDLTNKWQSWARIFLWFVVPEACFWLMMWDHQSHTCLEALGQTQNNQIQKPKKTYIVHNLADRFEFPTKHLSPKRKCHIWQLHIGLI